MKKANQNTPLCILPTKHWSKIDKKALIRLQNDQKYRKIDGLREKGQQEETFEVKGNVLYRIYQHPKVNRGKAMRQLIVPMPTTTGYESWVAIWVLRRPADKTLSDIYWPGIQGGVSKFCRSCEVCQRMVSKGTISKVPLQSMPLIKVPFKRVAVDIVGPIRPPKEKGQGTGIFYL